MTQILNVAFLASDMDRIATGVKFIISDDI